MGKNIVIAILFFFISWQAWAQGDLLLSKSDFEANNSIKLLPYIKVLPDPAGNLSFDTVALFSSSVNFHPLPGNTFINLPVHWVSFTIHNQCYLPGM